MPGEAVPGHRSTYASNYGHPDVIHLLLEHGADIETQNSDQTHPLHLAAW